VKWFVPKSVSDKIKAAVPHEKGQIPLEKISVDWSRSEVVADYCGQLYLNPKYRSENRAGEEGRAVIREICEKLSQLKDFDHGDEPLRVEPIWSADVYRGDRLENAPDALLKINDWRIGYTGQVEAGDIWSLVKERERSHMLYGANHRQEGILLAAGPDIGEGEIAGAQLQDVAPTALHMLGAALPDDMDGRVLTELFRRDSPPAQDEVRYQPAVRTAAAVAEIAEEDEEVLRKRLEDLGYM
jgi:predicted AlkP superfamily phosphohydrolase/phosphomutase